jgi:hypothetical protein
MMANFRSLENLDSVGVNHDSHMCDSRGKVNVVRGIQNLST